jgi:hypothetical protein
MQAFNSAVDLKEPARFQYSDFMAVIDKYGIHHNSVIAFLGGANE